MHDYDFETLTCINSKHHQWLKSIVEKHCIMDYRERGGGAWGKRRNPWQLCLEIGLQIMCKTQNFQVFIKYKKILNKWFDSCKSRLTPSWITETVWIITFSSGGAHAPGPVWIPCSTVGVRNRALSRHPRPPYHRTSGRVTRHPVTPAVFLWRSHTLITALIIVFE